MLGLAYRAIIKLKEEGTTGILRSLNHRLQMSTTLNKIKYYWKRPKGISADLDNISKIHVDPSNFIIPGSEEWKVDPILRSKLKTVAGHVTSLNSSSTNDQIHRNDKEAANILVIDYIPLYDQGSGSLRMFNILCILITLGHKVTFWPDGFKQSDPNMYGYVRKLQEKNIEVLTERDDFDNFIQELGHTFDACILSHPYIAIKYIDKIRNYAPSCKVIYDTVDLHFLRLERQSHLEKNFGIFKEAQKIHDIELALAKKSDLTFIISKLEGQILLSEESSVSLALVPNIHIPKENIASFKQRENILFVGGFQHQPNIDAAIHLTKDIFPLIKRDLPEVKLYIVGSNPTVEVRKLSNKDIIVTGYVPDISQYLNTCRVMVAPLRYGAGVKGKITESMCSGLPVVTTRIGAEGIDPVDGETAMIADNAKELARKIVTLYTDEKVWNKISINALNYSSTHYSPEVSRTTLIRVLDKILK